MKLGIIGTGTIVHEFLPQIKQIGEVEIVAIQGTRRSQKQLEQLCKEYKVPHAVNDFYELCRLDIDTVYIAVPNFLHFEFCKLALEHGLNVIVEKPATSNIKELDYLAKLAEEKELFLFEAITTLYFKNFKKMQEWLPRIGDVKLVDAQFSQYSRRYDAFKKGEVLPVFDPEKSGGALMDLNLYNLHLVMGLFGEPKKATYFANIERKIDTSGVLVMEYPHFKAVCSAAKDCKGVANAIIQGTKGCIKTTLSPNLIGEVILELNDGTIETYDDGMSCNRVMPEFNAFINAINAKDLSFCQKMLEKSIAVSRVQTKARLNAGIHFPADGDEQ